MPAMANDDARWMAAAVRLAARARPLSRPNPAVGAILVNNGVVAGRGWTQAGGRPHAEAMALAQAGGAAHGATAYVTLEPCAHLSDRGPACADILAAAQPARVVIGVADPDPRTSGTGAARLRDAGIEVTQLDDLTARASLAGYLTRAEKHRPFVTLKLAMSQDGFIARAPGQDQWITGDAARAHVHVMRAMQDAILVGGGTWRSDAPRLDVRLPGLEARSPRRIVLTNGALEGVTTITSPEQIADLAGVQYLYVEGGAATAQAFLDAKLVDQLHIYMAPITVGVGVKSPEALQPAALANSRQWRAIDKRQLGSDSFTAYQRES